MSFWIKVLLVYLVFMNIVAFAAMGIDKYKAKHKKWRIQEKTLFLLAIIGGSLGALYGMHLFRHKTKHKSFMFGIPAILIAQILIGIVWFLLSFPIF